MGINEKIIFGSLEELRGGSFMYDPQLTMFDEEDQQPLPFSDRQRKEGCLINDLPHDSDYLQLVVGWAIEDINRGETAENAIADALDILPAQDLTLHLDILKSCISCQINNPNVV